MPDYDVQIYATFKDLSQDTTIQSITVLGVNAQADGTVYNVTLPFGTNISSFTAIDIVVSLPIAAGSSIYKIETADGGLTWTVIVAAEDGHTQIYTVNVSVSATLYILAEDIPSNGISFDIQIVLKQIVIQVNSQSMVAGFSGDRAAGKDIFGLKYVLADGVTVLYSTCTITAPASGDGNEHRTTLNTIANYNYLFKASTTTYFIDITTKNDCITSFSISTS